MTATEHINIPKHTLHSNRTLYTPSPDNPATPLSYGVLIYNYIILLSLLNINYITISPTVTLIIHPTTSTLCPHSSYTTSFYTLPYQTPITQPYSHTQHNEHNTQPSPCSTIIYTLHSSHVLLSLYIHYHTTHPFNTMHKTNNQQPPASQYTHI